METRLFRTNLKCQNCVSKVASFLDADRHIAKWSVRTDDERKLLSVTGTKVDPGHIRSLVEEAGFEVLDEISQATEPKAAAIQDAPQAGQTYFPVILILLYLTGCVALSQLRTERMDWMAMMNAFMGGFFLVFSFFKLLNIRGFADAYGSYDIVARRFPAYGYFYPLIELTLGICYFMAFAPLVTNVATCVVISLSTVGVARSLMKKTRIQCACLGTVFSLPMSRVTLIEDLLMVGMSATTIGAMLW